MTGRAWQVAGTLILLAIGVLIVVPLLMVAGKGPDRPADRIGRLLEDASPPPLVSRLGEVMRTGAPARGWTSPPADR